MKKCQRACLHKLRVSKVFLLLQAIYTAVMSGASAAATAILTYSKAKKCMERARKRNIPSTKENLSEIATNLTAGNVYPPLTQAGFVGAVRVPNQRRRGPREQLAIVYGDDEVIQSAITGGTTCVFVDATFRVTPRQARLMSKRGAQVKFTVAS